MTGGVREWLIYIAAHPATFGIGAAIAAGIVRWSLGDRSGGIKTLLVQLGASLFVAWLASAYMAWRDFADQEQTMLLLLAAFVAKDLLAIIVDLAHRARENPLGILDVLIRIREALKGGRDK